MSEQAPWEIAYKCGQCSLIQRGRINPAYNETCSPECCPGCGNTTSSAWIRGSVMVEEGNFGPAGTCHGFSGQFKETL